jgi:hemerythrin-like domain-containing protein
MSSRTPTGVLREQHRRILKIADVLEEVLSREPEADGLDYDAVAECARFIRLYADALHHGKEENLLFVELEERGMSRTEGPLAVMLFEHQVGRGHVRAIEEALPVARDGDEEARRRMVRAGMDYVELIRGHIRKEDHVLFNWADQMIDPASCAVLCGHYDEVCRRAFDGCTVAELEGILAGLQARYPDA